MARRTLVAAATLAAVILASLFAFSGALRLDLTAELPKPHVLQKSVAGLKLAQRYGVPALSRSHYNFLTGQQRAFVDATSGIILVDHLNTIFYGTVQIGSPGQPFRVIFDTGSSNLVVPGSNCHSVACMLHHRFNSAKSSTFQPNGTTFNITYGSGGISGVLGEDTVQMGNYTVKATFGMIDTEKGAAFVAIPADGILGLAYQSIAADGVKPVYEDIVAKYNLPNKFSFWLGNKPDTSSNTAPGGYLWLGEDPDPAYVTGPRTAVPVTLEKWFAVNVSADFAGTSFSGLGVVDTGTSVLAVPSKIFPGIAGKLQVERDCSNKASLPSITFTMAGTEFELTSDQYVLQITLFGQTECLLGIIPINIPNFELVILGDIFLRAYAATFDIDNNQVIFQKAVSPADVAA